MCMSLIILMLTLLGKVMEIEDRLKQAEEHRGREGIESVSVEN